MTSLRELSTAPRQVEAPPGEKRRFANGDLPAEQLRLPKFLEMTHSPESSVYVPVLGDGTICFRDHRCTPQCDEGLDTKGVVKYTYGAKDFCLTSFYFLIAIVMHAIVQEYLHDYLNKHTKLNRKMHLSKMKHSKFNESGQLLIFHLVSFLWGADIIRKEVTLQGFPGLWEGYPHNKISFMFKFYFIIQLAYWLHCYPEQYFQKTKKDEMSARITTATLHLIFFGVSYGLNFSRISLCLSVMHYLVETVFHASRLLLFAQRNKAADRGYAVWNVLFVLVRLASISLSVPRVNIMNV